MPEKQRNFSLDSTYPVREFERLINVAAPAGEWVYVIGVFPELEDDPRTPVITRLAYSEASQPLSFDVPLKPLIRVESFPLALSPEVSASPSTTFQWHHNGTVIRGAIRRSLSINSVAPNDTGLYSLTLTDGADSISVDVASVAILPPAQGTPDLSYEPDIESVFQAVTLRDRSVLLANGLTTIVRLLPDGTVDANLELGGDPGTTHVIAGSGNPDDGRFFTFRNHFHPRSDGALYRHLPDGQLDPTFANGKGVRIQHVSHSGRVRNGYVRAMTAQPDGKLVIAGNFNRLAAMDWPVSCLARKSHREKTLGVANS